MALHSDLLPWYFPSTGLLLVMGVAFTAFVCHTCWVYAQLRHFPGPPLAGWSRLPLIVWTMSGRAHLKYQEISETYGPIARIAPTVLLSSDVEFMRKIAAARSKYRRNEWYMAFRFNPDRDTIISHRDDEEHARLKMKLAPGYSGKEIDGLEAKIDANVKAFVKLIETSYLSGPSDTKPFDLAEKTQFFTLDTIADISFGSPIGCLANDSDMYGYLKQAAASFPFFMVLGLFPRIMHILALDSVKRFLPSAKDSLGMGRIMRLASETAGKRFPLKDDEGVHRDMLGSFIRHGLTRAEAEAESLVQILAGGETTATTIRMTIFHVSTNPRVLNKLRAEIFRVRPSSPLTDAEAKNMPYLQAVVKEGLRIFPPITGLLFKDTPIGGDTYDGKFIPGGTAIGFSFLAAVMDKKAWGEDSHVFRPERFLEGSDEELRNRDAMVELVFGFGRWRCLGRNIAVSELTKVISELLRTFDFSVVNPMNPFKTRNAGIHLQSDMWMRAEKVAQYH
ncbi:pisatin demethylase [Podospora didyma]|uniref:Pisatin demethylase n=1 Tax=Podospora didyma TaxID=330526 RepID=A0AAE0U206_9PEZI|nr:pisatin demethylase [Podospora didyma]